MDVFTRCVRGWHLGRSLGGELTLITLQRALIDHRPVIHHSDQGVQYAAHAYAETLMAHDVLISMAEVGAAWQNGFAERLMRTIKEEAVELSEYRDYGDAYRQIGRFLDDVYMHKRIHSSRRLSDAGGIRDSLAKESNVAASLGVRNAQIVSSLRILSAKLC